MPGTHTTTIVMVDDSRDEIFLTRLRLQRDGVGVDFIGRDRPEQLFDTLAALANSDGDVAHLVILLDINMPGLGGFDLLQEIRAHDVYHEVPVVMMSSSNSESDRSQARALGATGYIVKPMTSSGVRLVLQAAGGDVHDRFD